MFIVGLLSWWYGAGWLRHVGQIREKIAATADYFSLGLLFTTLFAPFRQISASQVSGSIGIQWRAFLDRLVSRCVGAVMRLIMILLGVVSLLFLVAYGAISSIIWLIIPLLPFFGVILMIIEWVPTWL